MNYYEELDIKEDETISGIKRAYRRLAKKYHPDKNPDDERAARRFVRIATAYETLADEEKRKEYDESLYARGSRNVKNQTPHHQTVSSMNMSDEFANFFGFTADGKKKQRSATQAKSDINPIDTSQMFANFFGKQR